MNNDRASTWDANAMADKLFGPEGGMAVWVARPEVLGRAAVRKGGDLVECVTEIASMLVACSRLSDSLAKHHGVTFDTFMGMVEKAGEVLEPMTTHATRIMKKGPTDEQPHG